MTVAKLCVCKDRAASACPGEWEPGCDLGNNHAHVRVHRQPAADAGGSRYECIESSGEGGWAVEAFDSEGIVSRVLFMGADDEALAKEYASWKNASSEAGHENSA